MRQRIIRVLVLLLALALAACSALRLGYGQGPMLAYWWIDRYVDFDDVQAPRARAALDELFRWHRETQLADLTDLLARGQAQALEATTPAQVCRWNEELVARAMTAYLHALPAIAELAPTLQPDQLQHLARRYQRLNDEFRDEYLQDDPERRHAASVERAVDRAETIYGRLDDRQRSLIARMVAASPFDPVAWGAERRARQQDMLAHLNRWRLERTPPEQVQAELRRLGEGMLQSPREEYRAYQRRLTSYNCQIGAELHNAMTPRQRQHAAAKLKGWEDDLRSFLPRPAAR